MADIFDAPRFLTMNDFRAITDDFGGLAKSCRFAARFIPVGAYLQRFSSVMRDLTYLCEIAEFPGRSLTNIDVRYYGPNQKLPFQTTYEDMTFTFLCRTESIEREFFDDWVNIINPNNSFDFNYRDDYTARVIIYQYADYSDGFDDTPMATYKMTLHNVYPLLVNPQPATWQDDQFQRVQVSLTYTHWTRDFETPGVDYSLVAGKI